MSTGSGGQPRTLSQRFLSGAAYLTAGNWFTFAFNFGVNIALARILGPAAFGLYAFVVAVNEFINIIQGFSFGHALVQSRDESDRLYDTAYAASAGLGLVGLVAAAATAPLLALRVHEAAWFILILGVGRALIIQSWVPLARLERSLRYRPFTAIGVVSTAVPNLCALGMAWWGLGVWSLVLRDLLGALLMFLLASLWSRYRFRFQVKRDALSQILSFSRPMFLARALDTAFERADRLTIGLFFGDLTLGLYHQGRYLAEMGLVAARPINQLTFNLYSRLQDDLQRLRRSYGIVNYFLSRLSMAGGVVLITFPEETIRLLLGDAWLGTAPILRVLGGFGVVQPIVANLKWLLFARGKPHRNIQIRLVQAAVFLPGVALSVFLASVSGIALALVASAVTGLVLALRYSRDVVRGMLGRLLVTPLIAGALTIAASLAAARMEALEALPYFVWPFLPPAIFLGIILAIEGRTLLLEFSYLRGQLKGERMSPGDLSEPP